MKSDSQQKLIGLVVVLAVVIGGLAWYQHHERENTIGGKVNQVVDSMDGDNSTADNVGDTVKDMGNDMKDTMNGK